MGHLSGICVDILFRCIFLSMKPKGLTLQFSGARRFVTFAPSQFLRPNSDRGRNFLNGTTGRQYESSHQLLYFRFCPPDMEVCCRSCPMSFCFLLFLDVTMPGDRTPRCQDEERRCVLHHASHCHCRQDGSEDEEVRGGGEPKQRRCL